MPWLAVVDALMGAVDFVRWARGRSLPAVSRRGDAGGVEARLAGAAVTAVRDLFDRDRDRFELERERIEADRERAERALRLELLRQAGDREIGRLRVLTSLAAVSWLGALVLALAPPDGHLGLFTRMTSGTGWVLILVSLGASLSAQRETARVLGRANDRTSPADLVSTSGIAALWCLVAGLAAIVVGHL